MAKSNDPGAGASYQVGSTAGAPLEGVMAGEAGQELALTRLLAGQGGHPGHDPAKLPFGKGSGSGETSLYGGGNTWGE
jgi:hypothetical protein